MALTNKQRVFVEEYLRCWNATEAARRASYAHPNVAGPRLLVNVSIAAEIEHEVSERSMSADEVLVRLAEQARGEYAEFIDEWGVVNIKRMKEAGKGHLIKKVTLTRHSRTVEFQDPQAALFLLAKANGITKEQVDITTKGEKITGFARVSPDDWNDEG